jgi:hypothetical protein
MISAFRARVYACVRAREGFYRRLNIVANEIDKSASRIAYVVLQAPADGNSNPQIARVHLDPESLSPFMPARGVLGAVSVDGAPSS